MNKLVLGSLIAVAASQAAGCIISSSDNAHITVSWDLKSAATNQTATCPPGFDTAALYTQEVDTNGNRIGQPIIDLFNCSDGIGTTAALPPAFYDEWIEITNTDNTAQFARSKSNLEEAPSVILDVTSADLSYNTTVLIDGGYFRLGWDLVGASTNAHLDCASAGVTGGVETIVTVSGGSAAANDQFTCSDLEGITDPLPSASYTVAVDAFNSANQAIGPTTTLTNKVIAAPSALAPVTDLGTVQVAIDNK